MTVSIRFLGTAAFEIITAADRRILIDPYLDENPKSLYRVADLEHLDLLLVTHAAYDHLGDAENIPRRFPDLPLICGADVRGYLIHRGLDGERLRAILCHQDNAGLPEIVKFKDMLTEGRKKNPRAPQPVVLDPGESFSI